VNEIGTTFGTASVFVDRSASRCRTNELPGHVSARNILSQIPAKTEHVIGKF